MAPGREECLQQPQTGFQERHSEQKRLARILEEKVELETEAPRLTQWAASGCEGLGHPSHQDTINSCPLVKSIKSTSNPRPLG